MRDLDLSPMSAQDPDRIQPDPLRVPVVGLQPKSRKLAQLGQFGSRDRLKRVTESTPAAALHLNEDHRGFVLGRDDVQLPDRTPPVSIQDFPPQALQVLSSRLFAPLADPPRHTT